jgi:selenide,water dikinase
MMQGAADEFAKVNCTLLGGHTVDDAEIKLGFSITGEITDGRIYKNVGLREGDLLIYTKQLGTGLVSTALKAGLASEPHIKAVSETMLLSNYEASKLLRKFDCSACTDITGFGLSGHAYEMASGSGVSIEIERKNINIIAGAQEYASQFIIPAGAYSNMDFIGDNCQVEMAQDNSHMVFFDPQTSGGLLIGVSEKDAQDMLQSLKDAGYPDSVIAGQVTPKKEKAIYLK